MFCGKLTRFQGSML